MHADIELRVREFIGENFMFRAGRTDLAAEESLLEAGVVDSTGILQLVAFLEESFDIRLEEAEIVPENLDSIDAICAFVAAKAKAAPGAAGDVPGQAATS